MVAVINRLFLFYRGNYDAVKLSLCEETEREECEVEAHK